MTTTRELKELNRRRSALETYTEPLLGTNNKKSADTNATVISEFMSTFNKLMVLYESDFQKELTKFPETVGKHYFSLVPSEVNHKTFLQRYFFRCWDMERIKKDLDKQQSSPNKEEEKEDPATTSATEKVAPVTRRVATRPKTLSRFSTVRGSATKHTTSNPATVPPRRTVNPEKNHLKRMNSFEVSSPRKDQSADPPKTASARSPLNRSTSANGGVRFRGVPSNNPLVREAWGDSKDQDNEYDHAVAPPTPLARQATAEVVLPTLCSIDDRFDSSNINDSKPGLKSALKLKAQTDTDTLGVLFKPLVEQGRGQQRSISPKRPPPQLDKKQKRRIQSLFDPKMLAQAASQSTTNAPLPHRKQSVDEEEEHGNSSSDIVHSVKEQITAWGKEEEDEAGETTAPALSLHTKIAASTWKTPLGSDKEAHGRKWGAHDQLKNTAEPFLDNSKPPDSDQSSDIAHGKKLIVLISNMSGNLAQAKNQKRALSIIENCNLHVQSEYIDGADVANKEQRNELFAISCIPGNYPQFFVSNGKKTTFLGDFEAFENMNDSGTLARTIGSTKPQLPDAFSSDENNFPEDKSKESLMARPPIRRWGSLRKVEGDTQKEEATPAESKEDVKPLRRWGFRNVIDKGESEQPARALVPKPILSDSSEAESKGRLPSVVRKWMPPRNETSVVTQGRTLSVIKLESELEEIESSEGNWKNTISGSTGGDAVPKTHARRPSWVKPSPEESESPPIETSQPKTTSSLETETPTEKEEQKPVPLWKAFLGLKEAVKSSTEQEMVQGAPMPVEEAKAPTPAPVSASSWKNAAVPWQRKEAEKSTDEGEAREKTAQSEYMRPSSVSSANSSAEEETVKEAPKPVKMAKAPTPPPVSTASWKNPAVPWQKKNTTDEGEEGEMTAHSDPVRPLSVSSASVRGRLRKCNSNRQLDNSKGDSSGKKPSRSISMEPRSVGSVQARANKWGTVRTTVAVSTRFKDVVASSRKSNTTGSRSNESFNASMSVLGPTTPYQLASKSVIRADRRRNAADTYTKALDEKSVTEADDVKELTQFLSDFDYAAYDDDIQIAMAKYPTTVGVHIKNLVPEKVTAQAFWRRYFYRCDEKRILQSLRRREEAVPEPEPEREKPEGEKDDPISAMLEPEPPPKKAETNSVLNRLKGLETKSSEQKTEELKPAVGDSVIPRTIPTTTVSTGLLQDRLKGWKPKHAEEMADEEKPAADNTARSSVQSKTDPANKRFGRGSAQDRLKGLKSRSSEFGRKERRSGAPTVDDKGQYAADPSNKVGSVQARLKGWKSKVNEKKADYVKISLEEDRSEALSVHDTLGSSEQAKALPSKKASPSAIQDRLKSWKGNSVQQATEEQAMAVKAGVISLARQNNSVQDRLKDWTAESTTEEVHDAVLESKKNEAANNESISSHSHRSPGGRRGRISVHPGHSPRSGKVDVTDSVIRGRLKRFGQTSPGNPVLESPAEHHRKTLSITVAKD
jgi:hypothetical protein